MLKSLLNFRGPFSGVLINRDLLLLALLLVAILAQSIAVIYTKQTRRLLHAQVQALYVMRDKLQVEWSQLLLEQGTWQADARVEKIAREKLDMVLPDRVNVIVP